jgi:hypothetical protein
MKCEIHGARAAPEYAPKGDDRPPRDHETGFKEKFAPVGDLDGLTWLKNLDRGLGLPVSDSEPASDSDRSNPK